MGDSLSLDRSFTPDALRVLVEGTTITGLRAGTGGASGLVVALHGGGYDARYWHASDDHHASLLRLGASLGFEVVAVDRPGYRGSADADRLGYPLSRQAELIFGLIDEIGPAGPVYLIGHSMGGLLSLEMAGHARAAVLTAIDVSGVPVRYPAPVQAHIDDVLARLANDPRDAVNAELPPERRRMLYYGPDGSFDPALTALVDDRNPVPMAERLDAFCAPQTLPALLGRITTPTQWTIAYDERSSIGGPEMLKHIRSLMSACSRLITTMQAGSGHNISLHHVARAYHLRALAFFDEARLFRPD